MLFLQMEELCKAIRRGATTALLPRTRAALERGETVSFGQLELSPTGLACGKSTLAWDRVERVRVNPISLGIDQLEIMEAKGRSWAVVSVAQVANLDVLMHVLRERLKGKVAELRS